MDVGQFIGTILASPEFASLVLATFIGLATWLARSASRLMGEKLTAEQLKTLFVIAENAVRVAEQTGLGKTGAEKKAEAIRIAQTYLDAYGIKINAQQLADAIEAAVFSEFTQFKSTEVPVFDLPSGTAVDEQEPVAPVQ